MSTQGVPQRSWFGRNWKWFVPLGCLGMLAVIPLSCAAFVGVIFLSLRNSWAFSEGLELARKDPQVLQALGEPVSAAWIVSGNINANVDGSGNADISIPISGPKGAGTIYVVARKSGGQWKMQRAEVEIDGRKERINLLKKPGDDTASAPQQVLLGAAA